MEKTCINELVDWQPKDDTESCQKYQQLTKKIDLMVKINFILSNQIADVLNNIIQHTFVPQLKSMLEEKGLELKEPSKDYDWVKSPYAGFRITVPGWKYFVIGLEFEKKWLHNLIIGFLKKKEYNGIELKREDIKCWDDLQKNFNVKKGLSNQSWIYKDFEGEQNWHKSSAIEQIVNGTMVKNLKKMIEEMINCSNGLDV